MVRLNQQGKNVLGRSLDQKRRALYAWLAAGLSLALVVTLAVVSTGFDSRETPREEASVWVERSAGQFARVNTETGEIDTVRIGESPSAMVQSGSLGLLLTQGFGQATVIDPTNPQDVKDQSATDAGAPATTASTSPPTSGNSSGTEGTQLRTPEGTRQVLAAGNSVLFFTENGKAYVSQVASDGGIQALSAPSEITPVAGETAADATDGTDGTQASAAYLANAAALDEQGLVALYSATEHTVRWYEVATGRWIGGADRVPEAVPAEGVQLAIIEGEWVLFDTEAGLLYAQGRGEPVAVDTDGVGVLQASTVRGDEALIADEGGLWQVPLTGTAGAQRVAEASGVPAQPQFVSGEAVAAWISSTSATLWTAQGGNTPLQLDPEVGETGTPLPEIRSNGTRAVLIDRLTGMMWTVPDGRLIPVQQWNLVDPPKQETGTVITQDVTEQEPPVATADTFGVRAGEPTLLPVLLNDYDPNRKDVLTIVTEGLGEGLSTDFGTVAALSDSQALVLQPSATAAASASFSYRITDGVNVSAPTTVQLNVVADDVNTAPEWCLVDGCQRNWPSPEIVPGGTLVLPLIEGWVDSEGDPMLLVSAAALNPEDSVRTLVTEDGKLAVRHTDPNAPASDIAIVVTVADSRGATTERELRVRVRTNAQLAFEPTVTTVKIGEATVVRPLERVTGGSGSFQLVDAVVQQGSVTATVNQGSGTIELKATAPESALVAVTVRDSVTSNEQTGVMRVVSVESRNALAVPPLRAFVRPLADTTIDVLASIPAANSRALTVRSATVNDGQVRVDVIEHARVRVSGSTGDGQPGRIGSVNLVITEGAQTATARLTLFQVSEVTTGAIAVADTATVRAGSVVDIPVLENDVAPPGERLVLNPEVGAPGLEGELAFASGSNVRYLAPQTPGTYTLSYTTSGASSPEISDVGQVRVTVLPAGPNREPQPTTLTVRVAPGEQVRVPVPLSGADPDGDRLRLVSVNAPEDAQITTTIQPRSNTLQVAASQSAQRSTQTVAYTVRDPFGGEGSGRLRIIVTDPNPNGDAPVVYSDYVRLASGSAEPVTVRPLDNDIDPSGGTLQIVEVVPNVPGGESSPLYQELADKLDLSELKAGIVRITGGPLGTASYKYTVRSTETKSTADGLIVVQVSERVGQQAPSVSDTVLSVRDRADFERGGVDVVTDRVRWASGDVSTLKLSLWQGNRSGYSVDGSNIRGTYRAEGDLVTFRLSGSDSAGAEVETYGFLIVPPLDELRLTLKSGAKPVLVNENKTVEFNVVDMLDLGPGDRVELAEGNYAVQRSQASCSWSGGTTVSYTAGREGPWADTCTVRVRLVEQNTFTLLPIAVNIVPDEPVAQLNPLTRTIAPGQSETIDLTDMLEWQGGREGSLDRLKWNVTGAAGAFEIVANGSSLRAVARADAVPGAQESLTVSATGYGSTEAQLTLRVGEAAVDAPRGATIALTCTVGQSCSTPLVGVAGEYDPFAGKSGGGLQVVSVNAAACTAGTLSVEGNTLRVTWPDDRGPGGKCTASYTVRDAQNRTGTGIIEFDAQGVPRAPASITLVEYTSSSVTLEVVLGDAANAHPETTGVIVNQDGGGSVGNCEPSGATYRCVVGGLTIGERHTFTARAVNSVGESDPTANPATGWAFEAPTLNANQVSIEQLSAETSTTGTVRVTVDQNDSNVERIVVTAGGVTGTISGSSGSVTIGGVPVGSIQYWAQPISKFAPPTGGSGEGGSSEPEPFTMVGTPTLSAFTYQSADGSDQVTVTFTVDGAYDTAGNISWGASGGTEACVPNQSGETASKTFTAPKAFSTYNITICGKNSFGTIEQTQPVWVGGNPPTLTLGSYTVSQTAVTDGAGVMYDLVSGPSVTGAVSGATVTYAPGGSAFILDPNQVQSITATQCVDPSGKYCSQPSNAATWVNAPTTVTVQPSGVCYDPSAPPADLRELLTISDAAKGSAIVTTTGTVAAGFVALAIAWNGDFAALSPTTVNVAACGSP